MFKGGLSVLSCVLPTLFDLHLERVFVSRTLNKGWKSTDCTVAYVWITILEHYLQLLMLPCHPHTMYVRVEIVRRLIAFSTKTEFSNYFEPKKWFSIFYTRLYLDSKPEQKLLDSFGKVLQKTYFFRQEKARTISTESVKE